MGGRVGWRWRWGAVYSLWDGILSSLDLAEELLRYAVVEGELAVEHGEQDHAERPHVAGFAAVRPTCAQEQQEARISRIKHGPARQTGRVGNLSLVLKERKRKKPSVPGLRRVQCLLLTLWPWQILPRESGLIGPPASRLQST